MFYALLSRTWFIIDASFYQHGNSFQFIDITVVLRASLGNVERRVKSIFEFDFMEFKRH